MFRKTHGRLVLLNAIVLLCILVSFSAILYLHMQYQLFHQADETLRQEEHQVVEHRLAELAKPSHDDAEADRRTTYLLWGAQGNLIDTVPRQAFAAAEAAALRTASAAEVLQTVTVSGRRYRVVTLPNPQAAAGSAGAPQVAAVTLARSLEPEESMLRALGWDLGAGVVAGVVIAVLVGFFLAGRALVPIRRAWEKQQQFVADASHELRTPTAVILAQTEMLFRHPTHTIAQEGQHIAMVLQETKRMGRLVDDLLTLAGTDSDQLQIHVAPIPLDQVVTQVVGQFRSLAETKEITIHTEIQGPVTFWGDEARLRQLLVILLDNALKFTPPQGRIAVSCRARPGHVHLEVQDSGCGIAAADIPRIFERFYRADKARSRAEGGTGLGLSIAKWIVDAHGGEMRVVSQVDVGTEMHIDLPLRKHREV